MTREQGQRSGPTRPGCAQRDRAADPDLLRARLREARFQQLRQRRGHTEARIAIFKNAFLGAPLPAKSSENQARLVTGNLLTHNLWLLAGLPQRELRGLRKAS